MHRWVCIVMHGIPIKRHTRTASNRATDWAPFSSRLMLTLSPHLWVLVQGDTNACGSPPTNTRRVRQALFFFFFFFLFAERKRRLSFLLFAIMTTCLPTGDCVFINSRIEYTVRRKSCGDHYDLVWMIVWY